LRLVIRPFARKQEPSRFQTGSGIQLETMPLDGRIALRVTSEKAK